MATITITRTPVKLPLTTPAVAPQRRERPDEICPAQKEERVRIIRRAL